MRTLRRSGAVLLLLVGSAVVRGDVAVRVPVVTQVVGAVFYRTSVTVGNGSGGHSATILLKLTYRSTVDGTLQIATLDAGPLGPYRVTFYEDIIQHFKSAGVIRAADNGAPIFGTLLVTFDANDQNLNEALAEARTYSPANGGGTNAIAYIGRDSRTAGSEVIKAAIRNGSFGADGTTRANVGFVNEGTATTDVDVSFRDGSTGTLLRELTLDNVAPGEVVQLNNVFANAAIPPGTRTMVVRAQAQASSHRISGYAVQLDNVTNDGAFFLFAEEEDQCQYTPPGTGSGSER